MQTIETLKSLYSVPDSILGVFCSEGSLADNISENNPAMNIEQGLTSRMSLPPNSGGSYLTRQIMNRFGRFCSLLPFLDALGIMQKFDSRVVNASSGYDEGAVLLHESVMTNQTQMIASKVGTNTNNPSNIGFLFYNMPSNSYWQCVNYNPILVGDFTK